MTEMLLQKYLRSPGLSEDPVKLLEVSRSIKAKRHKDYPNLLLFKYSQIESDFNDPLVRECRGVILDESDNWRVVSRAFDKFGNYGEGYCPSIDWSTARVQEKLDGSLAVLYEYGGNWLVQTSGTPDASGDVNGGGITFAEYFWKAYGDRDLPPHGYGDCFIFELTGPLNRVVVQHSELKLTLLSVRNENGFASPTGEWTRGYVEAFADDWFPVVKEFPLQSFEDISKTFDTMNPLQQEGYVVVDGAFNRVKVKHPGYVALHHAKDGMGPKAWLEIARKGETSEVALAFPEFGAQIKRAHDAILFMQTDIQSVWDYLSIAGFQDATQKEFAVEVMTKYPKLSAPLFALRNGKTASVRQWIDGLHIDKLLEYLPAKDWAA